jgi:hypothetical protein
MCESDKELVNDRRKQREFDLSGSTKWAVGLWDYRMATAYGTSIFNGRYISSGWLD